MSNYTITITDPSGATETLSDDGGGDRDLNTVDIARTHTGLSDFSAVVPYAPSLSSFTFGSVRIEYDADTLFRGSLEEVTSDDSRSTTTLSGRGRARQLTDSSTTKRYQDILAHKAIEDYWSTQTGFTATVITPTPRRTVANTAQSPDSNSEFQNISSIGSTDPVAVQNGRFRVLQSGFLIEAESASTTFGTGSATRSDFSNGEGETFSGSSVLEQDVNVPYTIPSGDVKFYARHDNNNGDNPEFELKIDGTTVETVLQNALLSGLSYLTTTASFDVSGSTTLRIEGKSGSQDIDFDVFGLVDDRFSYNFDNTDLSQVSRSYLNGPELFPDSFVFQFAEAQTPWNIISGDASLTFVDSGEVANKMQMRLNGQTFYPNNGNEKDTDSITTTFGSDVGSDIQLRVDIGRRDETRSGTSPRKGYLGQRIDSYSLNYDGNDLAVIDDRTLEGDDLTNLQQLHAAAGMRFSVKHSPAAKEVTTFRVGDGSQSLPSVTVTNRRRRFEIRDYANEVVVKGAQDNQGNRPSQTLNDSQEINDVGKRQFFLLDPDLDTQADVDAEARKLLGEKLDERKESGTLDIVPTIIRPGFEYDLPLKTDGSTVTAAVEEVSYSESAGDASGSLVADLRGRDLAARIATLRRDTTNQRRVL